MADSLVPDEDLPSAPMSAAPPAASTPEPGGEVPAEDLPEGGPAPAPAPGEADQEKYGTGTQQAIAGLEGVAKGVAGPLATYAEKHILGVPEEDIAGRAEANPWTAGGAEAASFVGSMFTGVGEAALIGKAANAITKTAELGKVAQGALKLGIEGGLFHLADNASNMILDKTDPEAPVASFLAGTPAAVLLGGGLGYLGGKAGNKLQEIASSKASGAASKWLADFGSTFDFLSKNKDVPQAATEQAQHLYDTVSAATDSGFSLKRDSIEKLTKNVDPANVAAYVNGMHATLDNVPEELGNSSGFKRALGEWKNAITPTRDIIGAPTSTPSPADIFEATDNFKRKLGELAKFDNPRFGSQDQDMGKAAGSLYHNIRTSLENPGAWGEMGDFQKDLNGAYSKMQTPLKAFESTAMSKNENLEKQVDPAKIASIFRSVSKEKPLVGFKPDKVSSFFEPAKTFLDTVNSLHTAQGLESNIPAVPTDILDRMLNKEIPHGSKMAERLFMQGPGGAAWAASHAIGTAAGAAAGQPYWGFRAGEHLYPLLKSISERAIKPVVPAVLGALSAGEPGSVHAAIDYANGINNGASRIENSVNNLFKVGGKQYLESDHSDAHREKLKKYVEDGSYNQQIQNQVNAPVAKQPSVPGFAHGGEVMAPEPVAPVTKPVPPVLDGMKHISAAFPDQATLLGAAKGRINNYLNSIRPQAIQSKAPFDDAMPDKAKDRAYKRALDIANKPLSVLDHVKNGTLSPEHMQHMQGMYPELTSHLQKKISEKIVKAQMDNEKPPYKVRQGMSLFMGSDLDSTLSPANIMAAQSVFANQKAQAQAAGADKNKKGTGTLSKASGQYATSEQAAQARQSQPK